MKLNKLQRYTAACILLRQMELYDGYINSGELFSTVGLDRCDIPEYDTDMENIALYGKLLTNSDRKASLNRCTVKYHPDNPNNNQ